MNFFLDTNIPIGYSVIHDKYYNWANAFINNHQQDSLFWSNLVKAEYEGKFKEIILDINYFLITVESILENNENDFDYFSEFEHFIIEHSNHVLLDEFKKHKIIENFWNNLDSSCGVCQEIYYQFMNFRRHFTEIYFDRDKELNNIMNLHNCGMDNYLKYLDYALKLNSWGVHPPDCKILVDAHDCAINHNGLTFVSADGKMLESLKGHDTSFLKIVEFKSLN